MSKKQVNVGGRPPFPPHEKRVLKSVRVTEMHWKLARERAASEGMNIQQVIRELVEGYAIGKINIPEIVKRYK